MAIDAGVDEIAHMVVEPLDNETIKKMVDRNIYWVPTMELWKNVSDMYGFGWTDTVKENVLKFHEAGGKIALGTDYAGYSCSFDEGFPITEVTLMSEAGLSNMDIIISATKDAAFTCGISDKTGTLEVGKKADILITDGDPLADIKVLGKAKMVIHEGKIIKN
jgi:imidazolonepropionase-like amidohydrolase